MDKKVRYKLRKVKKRWVTVSVASAVMTLTTLSGGLVKADRNPKFLMILILVLLLLMKNLM